MRKLTPAQMQGISFRRVFSLKWNTCIAFHYQASGAITKEGVERLLEPEVWDDEEKTESYGHDKDHCFYQFTVAVVVYTRSRQPHSSME